MSAASILRKIAIAFHYGATAIAAAFFLISFCWIGGFLGLLVETMINPAASPLETMNNPAASPHYIGSIVGAVAAFILAVGLFLHWANDKKRKSGKNHKAKTSLSFHIQTHYQI